MMGTRYAVPRYDYPAQFADLDATLLPELRDVLVRGDYILGEPVARFERELAGYVGTSHAVGVNSGTDALVLALDALGVGPGDEVITVANTFHATAMAITRVGATPVFVDCDPGSYLIDLDQVAARITAATAAVVVVHMYGLAVDMDAAGALCRRAGVRLIEDCAQAIGARWGADRVGSVSDAGCWSFAPSKNLAAAGDAGAITVNDDGVAAKLRLLRHFGQEKQNDHRIVGYNSRLDTLQALVLSHKLPHVDRWNSQRAALAARYREQLAGLPVSFQTGPAAAEHVYHLCQVETDARDELVAHLQNESVDAVVRYPVPLHLQKAFEHLGYKHGELPVAERLAERTLCLPLFPSMTERQVDLVCAGVTGFFA
jgi:dTDP-4-amino-4,6-dideoxygalactose transaminase